MTAMTMFESGRKCDQGGSALEKSKRLGNVMSHVSATFLEPTHVNEGCLIIEALFVMSDQQPEDLWLFGYGFVRAVVPVSRLLMILVDP